MTTDNHPDLPPLAIIATQLGFSLGQLRMYYERNPAAALDLYRQVLGCVPPSVLLHLTGAKEPSRTP